MHERGVVEMWKQHYDEHQNTKAAEEMASMVRRIRETYLGRIRCESRVEFPGK